MEKPNLYVVARLLEALWRNRLPMRKTNLQMATGLNYQSFLRYLGWLQERGLVTMLPDQGQGERITLSEKGIDSYSRLVEWIREIVNPDF